MLQTNFDIDSSMNNRFTSKVTYYIELFVSFIIQDQTSLFICKIKQVLRNLMKVIKTKSVLQ